MKGFATVTRHIQPSKSPMPKHKRADSSRANSLKKARQRLQDKFDKENVIVRTTHLESKRP